MVDGCGRGTHSTREVPLDTIEALVIGVLQTRVTWDDWPVEIQKRLRRWNTAWLLSFHRGPDFTCNGGCARRIIAHPQGNAVVRPHRKAHGVVVCEDCLIAFARKYTTPPALGHYGAIVKLNRKVARQQQIIEGLEQRLAKMKRQCALEDAYVERLEELISPLTLGILKDSLRGKFRAHG